MKMGPWGVLCAIYQLVRLGVVTRFAFKGDYWQWRLHTAFGRGMPRSRWTLMRSVLEYGLWVHQVRRT